MNPLFEDKVKKIHELMKIMLENFRINFSYPDVEGLLDELPFPQLYLPLKKTLYEALLNLKINDDESEMYTAVEHLGKYGVSSKLQRLFNNPDEDIAAGLTFPDLEDFCSNDFNFCLLDLEKYNKYVSKIETYLIKTDTYKPVIQLIYTYLCPEAGVNIKEAIKGNKDTDSYFRELIKDDDLEYAIHFEDDINYWSIDEYARTYGKEVLKYKENMPPEYKDKYSNHMLVSSGWADGATIECKAPNFLEDLCEAFYASKGEYANVFFKQRVLDEVDKQAQDYIERGYECVFSSHRHMGHKGKILKWFDLEKVLEGIPMEECVSDYYLDKSIFMEILSPKSSDDRKSIDKIVFNYTALLKLIISILEIKKHYTISEDVILSILDSVYNRLLKASIVTTINLYTRKDDSAIKKSGLKEAIRKSHSIGTDRWNNCMAFYSDTLFKLEDLKIIAEHIPQMNRIIELM